MAGELDGSRLSIELKARAPDDVLLVRRGFHWINETPCNR